MDIDYLSKVYDGQCDLIEECKGGTTININPNSYECLSVNKSTTLDISCYYPYSNNTITSTQTVTYSIDSKPSLSYLMGTYPTGDYCENQNITLKASTGFTSYKWQYNFNSQGWKDFNPGTGSSVSFYITNIFGSNYYDKLDKDILFRYTVGNCSYTSASAVKGPYRFNLVRPYIKSNGFTITDPKCNGGNDGKITIKSGGLNRNIVSGEKLTFSLLKSGKEIAQLSNITALPAIIDGTNSTVASTGIPSGTYSIRVESTRSLCGDEILQTVKLGQPSKLVASTSVTSNYNGSQISCSGFSDGQVTVTASGGTGPKTYSKNGSTYQTSNIFSGLSSGGYTFITKDSNGCSTSQSITITAPLVVTISNAYVSSDYNGKEISCSGGSNGKITVEASGGTGILQYKVNSGTYSTSNIITGLSSGTYTVWVRDANNCQTSYGTNITITDPDVIMATLTKKDPVCYGDNSGSITINSSGGTGTHTYSLDNVNFQPGNLFNGLTSGSYTVYVKDQNNCVKEFNESLIDPAALAVTASSTEVSCYGGSDGTITISGVNNGVPPYTYSIDGTFFQNSNIFTALTSKNYSVIAEDANGCQGVISVFVDTRTPIATTFTETSSISCNGASDGAIDMTPSGGTAPYMFIWSNGAVTEDIRNLPTGTYSVDITDAVGCTYTDSYTLSEPFLLQGVAYTSDYNGYGVSCFGTIDGSIDLDVTGGTAPYTYIWSTGETTQDLFNIGVGTYSVDITDANGCFTSITDIAITEPDLLTISITSQTNVDCYGNATGSITVASPGGVPNYEYSVDGGVSWQTSSTFDNLPQNDYTIQVRDANGCTSSVSTTVTEPTLLTASVSNVQKSTCGENNGSAEAAGAGGTLDYSYEWRNSVNEIVGTSALLSGVGGGIYIVTVIDANGCTDTSQANISSADGPQTTPMDIVSTSCYDSQDGQARLQITGSAPFDIVWQHGETGTVANRLSPGDNVVTITDVNGCVAVELINIPSPEPITYGVTSSTIPTCHDTSDGSLEVLATGGTGAYTYEWGTGASGTLLNNVPSGTYALTITDTNGCILNSEVTLGGVDPVSILKEEIVLPTCVGDSDGTITVSALGGNGGYNYAWSTGSSEATIANLPANNYTLEVTDNKGCQITEVIELPDPEPFTIDIGDEIEICTGSSYQITADVSNGIYSWTSSNGFTSSERTVILSEAATYQLHVINGDGCEAEDEMVLVVSDDLLDADFLMATEAYVGDTVVVIDISWPIPEDLTWELPEGVTVLMENKDYTELVFNSPGTYAINAEVSLADCKDFYTQSITILDRKEKLENGRLADDGDLITKYSTYPNPSEGDFNVSVELSKKEDIRLLMVDIEGNQILFDKKFTQEDNYQVDVNSPGLRPGVYLLTLKSGGNTKVLRVMIK